MATAPRPLFRQAALDRIASPEDLDRLLVVTRPGSWIALLALLLIIGAALTWSFVGRLATYVTGPGLLINDGGRLHVATALGSGVLTTLLVKGDDTVTENQLIGRIAAPDIAQQLAGAREVVAERGGELQRQRDAAAAEIAAREATLAARRRALEGQRLSAAGRATALRAKLADEERLLRDQVVTRGAVLQTRAALAQAEQQVADAAAQIVQLASQQQEVTFQTEQRVKAAEFALADAERRLEELTAASQVTTELRAPVAGKVTEIAVNPGALVTRGQSVLIIETPGRGIEMLVFLAHGDGGRVDPGMSAKVSPSWTRREEEGSILATVAEVSRFPLTPEAIRSIVNNPELVRSFTRAGPPVLVQLRLARDPATPSGYAWTSQRGSAEPLTAGGAATADIQVRSQRPIDLAIPALRRLLGV